MKAPWSDKARGCAHVPVKLELLPWTPAILFIAAGLQYPKCPESSEKCAEFYAHSKFNLGKHEAPRERETGNQLFLAFIRIVKTGALCVWMCCKAGFFFL